MSKKRYSGLLIMWLFLSTEIMFFAALLGSYVVLRFGAAVWPKPHHVHLSEPIGAFNTFVLICSSVTVVLALEAARANKQSLAKSWMLLTLILGSLFLGVKASKVGFDWKSAGEVIKKVTEETEELKQALPFPDAGLEVASKSTEFRSGN